MNHLQIHIRDTFGIRPEKLEEVAALFQPEKLSRGDTFLAAGGYCQRLSFIEEGFMRVYVNLDGKEVTQWVSGNNYFMTEISSLTFGTASRWNIQALTDCQLLTLHLRDYQRLGELVPEWNRLEKLFLAKCFATLEDRVFSFLSMTAEERYQALQAYNKELFRQVPQQYLASMLGMTPETFSRIRRKSIS